MLIITLCLDVHVDELSVEVQPALIRAPMKRLDSIGEDSAIGTSIRTALAGDGVSTCSEVYNIVIICIVIIQDNFLH